MDHPQKEEKKPTVSFLFFLLNMVSFSPLTREVNHGERGVARFACDLIQPSLYLFSRLSTHFGTYAHMIRHGYSSILGHYRWGFSFERKENPSAFPIFISFKSRAVRR